jgi:hypothetical protein
MDRLDRLLEAWEQWSAELLESHVSYPMLSYYRSQHSDESWLAARAVIMDTGSCTRSSPPWLAQVPPAPSA